VHNLSFNVDTVRRSKPALSKERVLKDFLPLLCIRELGSSRLPAHSSARRMGLHDSPSSLQTSRRRLNSSRQIRSGELNCAPVAVKRISQSWRARRRRSTYFPYGALRGVDRDCIQR
jgi:hypothetical protein